MGLLEQLKENYRYKDYYRPDDRYESLINSLRHEPLTQELVDYLCEQIDNPKSRSCAELRYIHLIPLLVNPTAKYFDLKDFLLKHSTKHYKIWLNMFFIRGAAMYCDEEELKPSVEYVERSIARRATHIDCKIMLLDECLPYLCRRYGYRCFKKALATTRSELEKSSLLSNDFVVMNEVKNDDRKELLPIKI